MYCAIIERPDGTTYEQLYGDFYDLLELKAMLGRGYWIVAIY